MNQKTEKLEIIAFGAAARVLGHERIPWPYYADAQELIHSLLTRYPGLRQVHFVIAVNKELRADEETIPPGATVALLPPYAGG